MIDLAGGPPAPSNAVRFRLTQLATWAPAYTSEAEWNTRAHDAVPVDASRDLTLAEMPALLRRRAGLLQRIGCAVAYRALGAESDVPTVFACRYGDSERALELLTGLAHGESMSPTSFSLSVHNATGGLFSVARRDTANCVTLAAGEASAPLGMIEGCGLIAEGATRVLVVCADCALSGIYERDADVAAATYAWAGVLEAATDAPAMRLSWNASPDGPPDPARPPAGLSVLWFLSGRAPTLSHAAGGNHWHWTRDA
jgi:hypothetical protein